THGGDPLSMAGTAPFHDWTVTPAASPGGDPLRIESATAPVILAIALRKICERHWVAGGGQDSGINGCFFFPRDPFIPRSTSASTAMRWGTSDTCGLRAH